MSNKTSLSPGVISLDNSTLASTKENIRIDQLIPVEILEDRTKLKEFLDAYYTFMNMDEFIYQETETFTDVVLDNIARFRISDPNNENDKFFTDETGGASTLTLTSPTGDAPAKFIFDGTSNDIVDVGKVTAVTITNGGTNYTTATVTFSAPTVGITATGTATITDGSITGITITNPGNGYTSAPGITITGDGSLADADATIASNNQLTLSVLQQKALPIGTQVVYDVGDGTAIGGLEDDKSYFVVSSSNENVQLSLTKGGTPITLTGVGTGITHSFKGVASTMDIPLSDINVSITNGNELPGTLAASTSEIGKTFTVLGLDAFNGYSASLTTIAKYWVGPGPSWVMNNIETAMDIDRNETNYLELMQKEIASAIPRDVTVNKRTLYKQLVDFYKLRGSADSIEIFFRLLFNDTVETEFPYDTTLVPSSGKWNQADDIAATNVGTVTNNNVITLSAEDENILLSAKLVIENKYTLADDIRVTGIDGTSITLGNPAPTLINASLASIVDVNGDTILLDSVDVPKYAVGTKLTYSAGDGTAIGGLTSGNQYFVVSNINNKIQLSATSGGSAINLTALGALDSEGNNHSLTFQINIPDLQAISFVPRGTYLDNRGFLSYNIKLHDSLRYQKFSYLIKTGKNLSDWEYVYDKLVHPAGFVYFAEILIFLEFVDDVLTAAKNLISMPQIQPGVIGPEDIPLLVEMFASVFLPSAEAKIHKTGSLSLGLKNGVITGFNVTSGGSGYLTAPTITTTDSGTPSGFTSASLTATITNGSVPTGTSAGVTIVSGGKDYNTPTGTFSAPARIAFDGSDDEVAGTGIVNVTDNTIKLTTAQAAALPIGVRVTYDSGGNTAIGGLTSGNQYYIVYNSSNEVKLSTTSGGSVVDITGVGAGTDHGFTGETATLTLSKTDGELESITIVEPGFGYASGLSPLSVSFSGVEQSSGSGVSPVATIALDSDGRLDKDNISITNSGGGWSSLFATVPANANASSIASIKLTGFADKQYTTAPSIIFPAPTAKDPDGNLLSTNVTAIATFTLEATSIDYIEVTAGGSGYTSDPTVTITGNATATAIVESGKVTKIRLINSGSGYTTNPTITLSGGGGTGATAFAHLVPSEISTTSISNAGLGYVDDPIIKLGSAVHNEQRVRDIKERLILELNHNTVDIVSEVKTNPRQSSGSLRGYTLYDGQRFDVAKDTLDPSTNPDLTITQQTPVADKKLPEHRVKVINSNYRTIINNGYNQRKGSANFFDTGRFYNTNQTIEFLGSNQIQNLDSTDINNYNTNSFVNIE